MGKHRIVSAEVSDRYRSDGSKNMRNTAVRIYVHPLQPRYPSSGGSMYISEAIKFLEILGVDVLQAGFIDLLMKKSWSFNREKEIPPQYNNTGKGQETLF